MKKMIFILLILIILTYLTAQEFEINKISELAYAQGSTTSDCIQIIDSNLYYLSQNGLEIYEINGDNSLTKISMLTIPNPLGLMIVDEYCYMVNLAENVSGYNTKINKINISNVYNPVIEEIVEYPNLNETFGVLKLGNYLIYQKLNYTDLYYDFYSLPDLEYIGQVITDNHHRPLNDSLLVTQDGYILDIKQYNPPDEFEVIGTIDVSAYSDGNYVYDHYKVLNDTILSAVNVRNITFWDISDITNWQYISRYSLPEDTGIAGNKQYAIMDGNAVLFDPYQLRLLDISDISNPVLVDSLDHNMLFWGQGCDYFGNNLYVGTTNDGIKHFRIENNTVEYIDSYYDHKRFFIGDLYEDNLFVSTTTKGYYLFDVEDPLNPVDLGEWFNGKYYRLMHKQGGWIALKDFEDYTLEIHDITDPENPELRNTLPLDNYGIGTTYCSIDKTDLSSFYLCNQQTNKLWKFDISNPGEPVELFEFDLPSTPKWQVIINSIAYITIGSSPYDLLVIDGLDNNEPFLTNEINNFSDYGLLDIQEGYLIVFGMHSWDTGQIFQLDNPLQPELYFTSQWGNRFVIHDDLIFTRLDYIVSVYENRPNITEPMAIFNGLNPMYNIELMEHNGVNYLITLELANIGLFEYTYVSSSTEDELPKPEITLFNYPNPFNPTTTISFSIPEESNINLTIFNIKGQKIKSLVNEQLLKGKHSITWDGEDATGKDVCSGLYLYKLNINGKTEIVKKCMLLK